MNPVGDEAFSVKMVGYWRACNSTLLGQVMRSWLGSVHKRTTKVLRQYPVILASSLGNNPESFLLPEASDV